jgi:hypothetical protein
VSDVAVGGIIMNKLNAQIKKLRKLQKRVEKQRKLIERVSALNGQELSKKARKKMQSAGVAVKRVPISRRVLNKLLIAALGIGLTAGCSTLLVHAVKNRKKNVDDTTRYDVPYGEKDAQENAHFDLDQASLEELESALMKVENELDQVNAAIEIRK